jgi:GT2 family glycosyltransferase
MTVPDSAIARTTAQQTGVVIAVITYNNADHVLALIDSIRLGGVAAKILVLDNASSDDTVAHARSIPGITVVETGANLGYSGAINVARGLLAPGDTLVVLNPDLVLEPGAVAALLKTLEDPQVGIAVPLLRDPDGSIYPHLRREPSILGSLGDALCGAHWPGRPRWASDTLRRAEDYEAERDVAWAGGAALAIGAACSAAVGDWDARTFFLYSEETDYARRARDAGFLVRFTPDAAVTHVGGGSGQSAELLALMAVNRVRYFEKHHSRAASRTFQAVVALHHLLRSADDRHRYAARVVASRARWAGLPPALREEPAS